MPHISASLQSLTYSQEKNIKNRHVLFAIWQILQHQISANYGWFSRKTAPIVCRLKKKSYLCPVNNKEGNYELYCIKRFA